MPQVEIYGMTNHPELHCQTVVNSDGDKCTHEEEDHNPACIGSVIISGRIASCRCKEFKLA